MAVPEADGGVGGTLVDQAVAVEQFGASLACGPLFGTVYLAIPALTACPPGEAREVEDPALPLLSTRGLHLVDAGEEVEVLVDGEIVVE